MIRRHARKIALALLVLATAVGLHEIGTSGAAQAWSRAGDYGFALFEVFALAALDTLITGVVWRRVYRRLGVGHELGLGGTVWVHLSGYAGLLVPAQLGRLIRPDAMSRLVGQPFAICVRAEIASILLNLISVGGLLVALITFALVPFAALPACALSVACVLFVIERLAGTLFPGWGIPEGFWWSAETGAWIGVQMLAWIAHGLGLRCVLIESMPDVSLWEPVLFALLAALGGAASGIPGGLGVSEWLLGGSLTLLHVPGEDLAISVAVFRAASQWIWLPIGWLALAAVRRRQRAGERSGRVGTTSIEPA